MRRIILFVSAMLVALFASLTTYTTPARAQTPEGDFTFRWVENEDKLVDGAWVLVPSPTNTPVPDISGTACNGRANIYYSGIGQVNGIPRIFVVCFDEKNRTQTVDAQLFQFNGPPVEQPGVFSQNRDDYTTSGRSSPAKIVPAASSDPAELGDDTSYTTCSSEFTFGLGWIICPVTRLLAHAMDQLFAILTSFLKVTPLSTNRDGPIYYVWSVVQNLANILFIFAFLIIIYSQITGYGISSYGIKKLLPRLLIGAVLVNISYWITALAVDLSNVFGMSLQDVFIEQRARMPTPENITLTPGDFTWQAAVATTLAGGAGAAVVGGALFSFFTSAGASLWFILVGLMSVGVSVLVALLVLAARQALITILIIISPLAFVAFLLPNTEKYFDRWRSLFTTLLLVFPIFSVVFGGAQLAGLAIIYSAFSSFDPNAGKVTDGSAFNLVILGMIVQVTPLIITPLLIKLSGGIIGRISGIVNNPNKGLIDQTRNFAQRRHDMTKNRMWESTGKDANGNILYRRNDPLAQTARRKALSDMNFAHRVKAYEAGAEAAFEQDHRSHAIHEQSFVNESIKAAGADAGRQAVAEHVAHNAALQRLYVQKQVSHDAAELAESRNKTMIETMKVQPEEANAAVRDLARQAHHISNATLDETQRQTSIHQEHESHYWKELTTDTARQAYAGAAGIAAQGEARVANLARQKQNEEREKVISAGMTTIGQLELTNQDLMDIINGVRPTSARAASLRADFHEDIENRSAAVRSLDSLAHFELQEVVENVVNLTETANGNVDAETLRSELAAYLQTKRKPIWISNTILNNIKEGTHAARYHGPDGKALMIKEELFDKRGVSAKTLSSADRDDLRELARWVHANRTYVNNTTDANAVRSKRRMQEELIRVYKDSQYAGTLEKRVNELDELWVNLGLGSKDRYTLVDGEIRGL